MGVLLLITIIVGIALISNIRIGDSKDIDPYEFEMDSYDDEQHF